MFMCNLVILKDGEIQNFTKLNLKKMLPSFLWCYGNRDVAINT